MWIIVSFRREMKNGHCMGYIIMEIWHWHWEFFEKWILDYDPPPFHTPIPVGCYITLAQTGNLPVHTQTVYHTVYRVIALQICAHVSVILRLVGYVSVVHSTAMCICKEFKLLGVCNKVHPVNTHTVTYCAHRHSLQGDCTAIGAHFSAILRLIG